MSTRHEAKFRGNSLYKYRIVRSTPEEVIFKAAPDDDDFGLLITKCTQMRTKPELCFAFLTMLHAQWDLC